MLGVGWTEMLVIGVVALIVIGPKELPALMNKIGKFAGTVRRMGSDFQRELNKTTGLDEVKNLRNAITQPLKSTTDAIRKEFNATTSTGAVKPSGALKPADPKAESVVDEIHKAAGMATPAEPIKGGVVKAATTPVAMEPIGSTGTAAEPAKAAAVAAIAPSTASPPAPAADAAKPQRTRAPKTASPAGTAKKAPARKKTVAKKTAGTGDAAEAPKPARKRTPAAKKSTS